MALSSDSAQSFRLRGQHPVKAAAVQSELMTKETKNNAHRERLAHMQILCDFLHQPAFSVVFATIFGDTWWPSGKVERLNLNLNFAQ